MIAPMLWIASMLPELSVLADRGFAVFKMRGKCGGGNVGTDYVVPAVVWKGGRGGSLLDQV